MTIATISTWGQIALSALIGGLVAVAGAVTVGRLVLGRTRRSAYADHLTGVANRRAFVRRLQREWTHSAHDHTRLGLLVIDVDAFGDINDLYGRETGDRVLAEVAERINLRVRSGDYVARLEADEFGVICPGSTEDEMAALRRNLEAYVNYARTAPVVLSIGIASRREDDDSFEDMLRRARESVLERRNERPIRAVDDALAELLS